MTVLYVVRTLLALVSLFVGGSVEDHHHLVTNPLKTRKHHRLPWCPPLNFANQRRKSNRVIKTAIITEIHGQLVTTGRFWGTFLPGNLLARNIYHHIGVLGFDKMYINVIYNDTVHQTPPTVVELYPEDDSCVAAWFALGVFEVHHVPYEGPRERWPLDDKGEPSTEKDLYKTLRGINPIYDLILQRREADWVMVLDADELLYPINWNSSSSSGSDGVSDRWCSHENPSILEMGLEQMLSVASTEVLQTYPQMVRDRERSRAPSEACITGFGINAEGEGPSCREISSIIFPVRMWTKYYGPPGGGSGSGSGSSTLVGSRQPHRMPQLRSKIPSSYTFIDELNKTVVEEDHQYHQWKSIHQTRFTPVLTGPRTMHYGGADTFKIVAPRDYHGGISFEIAHVRSDCGAECRQYTVLDETLQDLSLSYQRCMATLPS